MQKQIKFYKKRWVIVLFSVLVIGVIGGYAMYGGGKQPQYDFVLATKGNISQEVSVTGIVKPVQIVDLAFQTSGRVGKVYFKVGDKVKVGDKLVALDSADMQAQLRQAQAGVLSAQAQLSQYLAALESQQARLDEMRRGTRPEEIQIAETNLYNAQKVLEDAQKNLENVNSKVIVDLDEAYSSSLTSLPSAALVGKEALFTLTDIQYAHFSDLGQESVRVDLAKAPAVQALLGTSNAGRWTTEFLSRETGGAYGVVQEAVLAPTHDKIDSAIVQLLTALQKVKSALDAVPVTDKLTSTERLNLDTAKSNVSTQITVVSGKQKAISVQKAMNTNLAQTAEAQVNTAKNNLASAQNELDLRNAGYTDDQIKAQEAAVSQAKASMASQKAMINQAYANAQRYQAELDKTVLVSPLNGIVTQIDAKVGEIVFPTTAAPKQTALATVMSEGNFQIEANVAEVDIAKVKLGDKAKVTLDAYGNDVGFEATVTKIDPAETLVEGVSTYKTTFQFTQQDERVKSGMTANLDILTDKRENVIVIPQRAVTAKDGERTVRLLVPNQDASEPPTLKEVPVKTGLRGTAGQIEIIEGVNEGDKVVTLVK